MVYGKIAAHEDMLDNDNKPADLESDFSEMIGGMLKRRSFVGGGLKLGLSAMVVGMGGLSAARALASTSRLRFEAVAANSLDTVTTPKGYSWRVVASWGQPLWSDGRPFDHAATGSAADQKRAFGDNNDGMTFFTREGRHVLAVNNEYVNLNVMFEHRADRRPLTDDDVAKIMAAHGVSIVEVDSKTGVWSVVMDSPYNRRIDPMTVMEITGPARGHELMKTAADPSGTLVLGTQNNCGCGRTPWGTYLTCEENFNKTFSSSAGEGAISPQLARYGLKEKDRGYDWARIDPRFHMATEPNEANRFGYVVEIDPFDPASRPKKRTALGRFKHENAEVALAADGRVVVYMGDDERGEFLYKYVSDDRYAPGSDVSTLLDKGTLYAARFRNDLSGQWLELSPRATGVSSYAEICIHTRQAASSVGATTMDRPEWVTSNPHTSDVYCALTNNKDRGVKPNAGGDPTPVGGPNPRKNNIYGQIVRLAPHGGDHGGERFSWDLFAMAGNPVAHRGLKAGSKNITPENMFNCPDGLAVDSTGLLWILTDGKYSDTGDFAGMGNNQMLCADPQTGEIRRFLVGPKECEVTGIAWSADKKTLFVNMQHPGEKNGRGASHFPEGGDKLPRSSVIAITRDDGAPIG